MLGNVTEEAGPVFSQLNIVVRDLAASAEFYRRLDLVIDQTPDGVHASAELPGGLRLEWDSEESAALWDSGSRGAAGGSAHHRVLVCRPGRRSTSSTPS